MPYSTPPQSTVTPPLTSHTGFTLGNGSTDPTMSSGSATETSSTDGWYPAVWATPVDTDSQYSQVKLTSAPITHLQTPSNNSSGPVVRCNSGFTQWVMAGSDASGIYIMTATSGSGGTVTVRATYGTGPASGDVIKLQAVGNLYTLFRNGASVATWTDSGGVISIGPSNRLCGLFVSHGNFNGSCSMSTALFGDLYPGATPINQFAPMLRSSTR
jgi:hypothetical protein